MARKRSARAAYIQDLADTIGYFNAFEHHARRKDIVAKLNEVLAPHREELKVAREEETARKLQQRALRRL